MHIYIYIHITTINEKMGHEFERQQRYMGEGLKGRKEK